jgi:hypothetical protein
LYRQDYRWLANLLDGRARARINVRINYVSYGHPSNQLNRQLPITVPQRWLSRSPYHFGILGHANDGSLLRVRGEWLPV